MRDDVSVYWISYGAQEYMSSGRVMHSVERGVARGNGCCHLREPPTARPRGFQESFQIAVDGSVLSLKHVGSSDHFTVVRMDDSDGVFQVVRGFCWLVYGSTGRFVDSSQVTKRSQAPLLFSTG